MRKPAVALFVSLLVPGTALGQAVEPELGRAAERHRTVYVVDSSGSETAGRLLRADQDSITILARDGERTFELRDDVQSVYRRGDSVRSGATAGAVSGAVLGLLASMTISCGPLLAPYKRCNAGESLVVIGFGTGIGAGIGTGIDALVRGRTRIYPSLTRRSAGAMISTAW